MITHHNNVLSVRNQGRIYSEITAYSDLSFILAPKVYVLKPSCLGSWWKYNLTLCLSFWHIVCKHTRERNAKMQSPLHVWVRVNTDSVVLTKNRYTAIESWLIQTQFKVSFDHMTYTDTEYHVYLSPLPSLVPTAFKTVTKNAQRSPTLNANLRLMLSDAWTAPTLKLRRGRLPKTTSSFSSEWNKKTLKKEKK